MSLGDVGVGAMVAAVDVVEIEEGGREGDGAVVEVAVVEETVAMIEAEKSVAEG